MPKKMPADLQLWKDARRRHKLSHAHGCLSTLSKPREIGALPVASNDAPPIQVIRRWTDSGKARDSLVELFGGCRFALLGEASHGTHARRQDCPGHWHHPPLLFRAHSRGAGWLETGGPVSGLLSDVRFESGSKGLLPVMICSCFIRTALWKPTTMTVWRSVPCRRYVPF